MNAEVSLRFVSLLDRLSNPFDGTCEALEARVNGFEADGDALEKFGIKICFGV
jgi:hypothetical protein